MKPFKRGYKITQLFGESPTYYSQWGFKAHEGIDLIPTDSDWNIHSMEDGVVLRDIDTPRDNYGIHCVIWNKDKKRAWWYCHLENNNLNTGQFVKAGDVIGKMGSTGKVTGAHLHLGLRLSDSSGNAINTDNGFKGFIDPLPLLEELNKEVEGIMDLSDDISTEVEDKFKLKEVSRYNKYWSYNELIDDWIKLVGECEYEKEEKEKYKKEARELREVVESQAEEIQEANKEIERLSQANAGHRAEIAQLQAQFAEVSRERDSLLDCCKGYEASIPKLRTKIKELEDKLLSQNPLKDYSAKDLLSAFFDKIFHRV